MEQVVGPMLAAVGAGSVIAGTAAVYYMMKMPDPTCIPPVELNDQAYVLEDGVRCSKMMPKGELVSCYYEDVQTLHDAFMRGLRISADKPCLGSRTGPNLEYEWMTYQQVYDDSVAFGSWLLDQGLKSGTEDFVAIYSANRTEWVLTEKACCAFNIVAVALYESLGKDASVYILSQTCARVLVCDNAAKANTILAFVADGLVKDLKFIVVMDGITEIDQSNATKYGVTLVDFKDALEKGKASRKPISPPKPDDLAFLCYTSGTTGANPKGVMIKHKHAIASLSSIVQNVEPVEALDKGASHISYLPLAHVYERLGQVMYFQVGARIGFFRGDVKLLFEDIQTLKPTCMLAVPRVLNKVYDKVIAGVAQSRLKSKLFQWAMNSKMKEVRKGVYRTDGFWDKLVFKKVQALFGGNLHLMITGSAPLSVEVLDFYRAALGCMVLEGYGQTEAVTGITFTVPGDDESGVVGPPMACNIVKLVDVPEYGYYAKNNQGEVCAKGTNITSGYYKDPERTAEVFDKDGWLHTGDIGEWLPNGVLKIIDRKKNLFKLAQGEYIAPEKIETVVCRSNYVAQAFVDGDSLQAFFMCVVVPDEETLMGWAKKNSISGSFQELCQSQSVKELIMSDIRKVSDAAELTSYEKAKDIIIHPELFSVENGFLTPTFKNKRPAMKAHFKAEIAELYKKHTA